MNMRPHVGPLFKEWQTATVNAQNLNDLGAPC